MHEALAVVVRVVEEVLEFGVHGWEVDWVGDAGGYYVADFAFGVDGCYVDHWGGHFGGGEGVGGMLGLEEVLVCVDMLDRDDVYLYQKFRDLISFPVSLPCIR